jgi:type I restriction enzyme R subunit
MGAARGNFEFLEVSAPRLLRLARLAERYFADDPPGALIKLRSLAEFMAKDVAARHGLLPGPSATFDDTLRVLKARAILPRQVADMFYHLKHAGNAATHEDRGTASEALLGLKIARSAAVWFHQTYGNAPGFRAGPFVPPQSPADATKVLQDEIAALRNAVAESSDAEAKARMRAQEADAERTRFAERAEEQERDRSFWEQYAATTEAALRAAEQALAATQAAAAAAAPHQLDLLAELGARNAQEIELDEATTRVLIDEQLRAAGWEADTAALRHGAGARPQYGKAMAIAEWPTRSGPVDYALFVDGRCVGVV